MHSEISGKILVIGWGRVVGPDRDRARAKMVVLPHFAQCHLLTLTPTPTPNPLTLAHWANWDWAKWEDTKMVGPRAYIALPCL